MSACASRDQLVDKILQGISMPRHKITRFGLFAVFQQDSIRPPGV